MTSVHHIDHEHDELSDYAIGRVYGRGAFSVVYAAVHKATGDNVAVKVIKRSPKELGDPEVAARQHRILDNEVNIMKRLSSIGNPNLLNMHAHFEHTNGDTYLVLDACTGGELFDRIVAMAEEGKNYSEHDASELTLTMCRALQALHANGILHRDLKPENLLFATAAADAPIKVMDFGLAMIDGDDVHHSVVGTPGYVAPEVLIERRYGPECDVFSFGVVVYILLVGYPPYSGEDDEELFEQIKAGDWDMPAEDWDQISDHAKELITRMLDGNPATRITLEEVATHPWIVENMPKAHLTGAVKGMKKLQGRKRFKAVAKACIRGSRLRRATKMKELLLPELGRGFSHDEQVRIQQAFERHVSGGGHKVGGFVCKEDFCAVMTELGFEGLPLDALYGAFDHNRDGRVDFREFLLTMVAMRGRSEEALRVCFRVYDSDDSGGIDQAELSSVLMHLAGADEASESEKAMLLSRVFTRLDTNGDGKISFEEFRDGIALYPTLVAAFLAPVAAPAPPAAGAGAELPPLPPST